MSDKTYNGWANYATWRVNLEMFDGMNLEDLTGQTEWDTSDLAEYLKDWAEEWIEGTTSEGLGRDYAMAFLSYVDWWSIAKHMIVDYADEVEE